MVQHLPEGGPDFRCPESMESQVQWHTCDPSAFTARVEWMQGNPWTLMYREQHELCLQLGKEPGPTPKAVLWPPHNDVITILTLMYTAVNNTQLSPSRWRAKTHTKAVLWPPQRWCLTSYPPIFTQTQISFTHTHKHIKNRTTKFIDYTLSTTKYWPYLNMFNNTGLRTISVLSTVITSSMAVGKATEPALLRFPRAATESPGQNHLRRKVLRWLTQYSSSRESEVVTQTGTWRQELMKQGPQGNTAYWLLSLGYSATFLKQPNITCSGVGLPTGVWALLHQLANRKCPKDMLPGQSDRSNSSTEVLFEGMSYRQLELTMTDH